MWAKYFVVEETFIIFVNFSNMSFKIIGMFFGDINIDNASWQSSSFYQKFFSIFEFCYSNSPISNSFYFDIL